MARHELVIEGARQNNLKNIDLRLPHNKVIAVTGVSGSGKSSLAFDTIFAEGQWRFIESLSTYARLFLEKLDRPDVEAIHQVRPAIALEQKNPVRGSRSTVGTLTELHDLLRILYARIATPRCPKCGREIRRWEPSQIVGDLLDVHPDARALILFLTEEPPETLRQRGFHRFLCNGEVRDLDGQHCEPTPVREVVVDRLVIRDEPRLSDSIEMAWKEGKGAVKVIVFSEAAPEGTVLRFSSERACDDCGIPVPEPTPILFSFNHPLCACPECKGFGNILVYDEDLIVPDKNLSLEEGAIDLWEKPSYRWWRDQLLKKAELAGVPVDTPYARLNREQRERLFKGCEQFYGIDDFFEEMESRRYKLHVRVLLSRYRTPVTCPRCKGKRLCDDALAYKIEHLDIAELSHIPVSKLVKWFDMLALSPMQRDIAGEAIRQIVSKLLFLNRVGLGYLTLSRQAKTLSGGEYQRVNLANQLGSALTGTLYVLDEPTIGLHPRDTSRIADIMKDLASLGNTILVVEHDRDVIASADWVVELGPGGGHLGGEVVFSGDIESFLHADTLTAQFVRGENGTCSTSDAQADAMAGRIPPWEIRQRGRITLEGAVGNNLRDVTLRIPVVALSAVSGVSGSGKSSLVIETFYRALARHLRADPEQPLPHRRVTGLHHLKAVRLIDQSPIGKSPRSNPLTYLKMFDPVRRLFANQPEAKAHGYSPGFFSFNLPGGRCETCKGEGFERMEMYFFEDMFVKCEDCKGRRYREDALMVTYRGKNISEVLDMTVEEAFGFFSGSKEITGRLNLMRDIGLGYLRLGQPATTLSGGEAQRLKICAELSLSTAMPSGSNTPAKGILYLLDEPTVGLHHKDVVMFMRIIRRLVAMRNTVVIIEHNPEVISQADWVVDLGPEGGDGGGMVIFEGTPEELKEAEDSHTGAYLRAYCTKSPVRRDLS
jgi:excinuclease ABC subunit A